jgi:pimeloyl-ACP methyl ester carboxylesterase
MLSYSLCGRGRPLLMIHGFGVTRSLWSNLQPLLANDFQLVLPDMPGFGGSPPPSSYGALIRESADGIDAIQRRLGFEEWDLVAYSVGSWIALDYMTRYRSRWRRAVLVCPLFVRGWRALTLDFLRRLDLIAPAAITWLLHGPALHSMVVRFGFTGTDHPYASAWTREIRATPIDALKGIIHGAGNAPQAIDPSTTLVLWGESDVLATPVETLAANARVVPGSHSAPLLEPDSIAHWVRAWILAGERARVGAKR